MNQGSAPTLEEIFGESFVKYRAVSQDEVSKFQEDKRKWEEDGCMGLPPIEPQQYFSVTWEEAFPRSVKFIGLFFSANYCPPCKKVLQPFHNFYQEFNKDSLQFQMILVNCDRSEKDFREHLAEMPWILAVPQEHSKVMEKLEDMAQAETIPRLAIINIQKSI
eukprot:CAMPEP_0202963786 /NCGR_PEP_ID=MMETSP1396-20130829/7803_1 /ASSEMBLY_ACC=CAM_ASM_000872 /TAXON_ID= /ORGANISM="Pseudokeronopsis sp., Strain Brazil" /LENGTH=162 /DNA_ID=CAMNT_0049685293 /DNA_START=12 /DNA_END=500 /DNA_ORIENTATION=+